MRLLPVTWLVSGFAAYAALGLAAALSPILRRDSSLFLILGAVLLALLVLLGRWERRKRQPSPSGAAWTALQSLALFSGGALLSWLLVLGTGRLRYAQVERKVDASQLRPNWPGNDLIDESDRNGYVILRQLGDSKGFKELFESKGGLRDLPRMLQTRDLAALRRVRPLLKPALLTMERARKAPVFSWNIRYDVPYYQIEIPRIAPLVNLNRCLVAEALLLRSQGQTAESEARLLDSQWLSRQLRLQGSLIGVMVSVAMEELAMDVSKELLLSGQGGRLASGIHDGALEKAFKLSASMDFLLGPPSIRGMKFRDMEMAEGALGELMSVAYLPWMDWDVASGLENNLKMLKCMDSPALAAGQCQDQVSAEVERSGWLLQSIAMPKYSPMLYRVAAATARQRLALIAHEAALFRKRQGRFPKSLAELGEAGKAQDPFTGLPFQAQWEGGKLRVRCLGADNVPDTKPPSRPQDQDLELFI